MQLPFTLSKIALRVWSVLALVYAASVVVVALVLFRGFRTDTLQTAEASMRHRLELAQSGQLQLIHNIQQHALVLSKSPQVMQYASAVSRDTVANDSMQAEAAKLFAAFLAVYPEYFQLRILSQRNGRELLRLNRTTIGIEQVPKADLQSKRWRAYFTQARNLKPGTFYLSEVNLNQEHGRVSVPYVKTLRAATPVADAQGNVSCILVINADVSQWFDALQQFKNVQDSIYLLNAQGDFVFHPNDEKTFASKKPSNLAQLSAHDSLVMLHAFSQKNTLGHLQHGDKVHYAVQKTFTYGTTPQRQLTLVATVSSSKLFAGAQIKAANASLWVLAAMAAGLVLLLLLSNSLVKPVKALDKAVKNYLPGKPFPKPEHTRNDELGNLATAFQNLTTRVNEQIHQLHQAQQRAQSSVAEKETFIGNFSHELRTPLNSVAGMTEMLAQKPHTAEQRPLIEALKYSIENLRSLISDVLDYNRIVEGKLSLNPTEVVVEELARNVCLSHQLAADAQNTALSYKLADELPPVLMADKLRLSQVLHNLLSNAIKFTQNGQVELSFWWENNALCFCVADNGSGIEAEELPNIFDRHHQTQKGRAKASGVGLGLAIVKNLVALFGGRIEVASEAGKGTEMTVHIPTKVASIKATDNRQAMLPNSLCVLYVDDVELNRITMQHFLNHPGIKLLNAACCTDGLQHLKNNPVDVVLMDLRMPEMDGFECIAALRKDFPHMPVIAVSANLGDTERNRLAAMGIHHSIEKPVDPTLLAECLLQATSTSTRPVYKALLASYCQQDHTLLTRVAEGFRQNVENCQRTLENTAAEALPNTLSELRHMLAPSLKMFDRHAALATLEEHPDDAAVMRAVLLDLLNFMDAFERENLLQ